MAHDSILYRANNSNLDKLKKVLSISLQLLTKCKRRQIKKMRPSPSYDAKLDI